MFGVACLCQSMVDGPVGLSSKTKSQCAALAAKAAVAHWLYCVCLCEVCGGFIFRLGPVGQRFDRHPAAAVWAALSCRRWPT